MREMRRRRKTREESNARGSGRSPRGSSRRVPAGGGPVPVSESSAGSGEPQKNAPVNAADAYVADEVALTAEMTALRQRMIQDYGYDPLKNHQLNFTKTALYARPGNQ